MKVNVVRPPKWKFDTKLKKQTVFGLWSLIILIFAIFSPTVFAEDSDNSLGPPTSNYYIYVTATSIGDYPSFYVAYNGAATGNTLNGAITYDVATNTLTLNNFKNAGTIRFWHMGELNVHLVGDNTFYETSQIYSYGTNITITGNGSLSFDTSGIAGNHSSIWSDYITIESGTINSQLSNLYGIKGITVNGGTLNMVGGSLIAGEQPAYASEGNVIVANSQLIVNGGTINFERINKPSIITGLLQMNGGVIKSGSIMTNILNVNGGILDALSYSGNCISAETGMSIQGGVVKSMAGGNSGSGSPALVAPSVSISANNQIRVGDYQRTLPYSDPPSYVSSYSNEPYVMISGADVAIDDTITGNVSYRTHVQNIGWQGWKNESNISGTSGRGYRLEAIEVKLNGIADDVGVRYRTHVENIGWQDWVEDGNISGTSGKGLRLEAIEVELTGNDREKYDVYYTVHAQNLGWLGWTKNGEQSGTAGYGYRLEGIKIVIVPKGETKPPIMSEQNAFYQKS